MNKLVARLIDRTIAANVVRMNKHVAQLDLFLAILDGVSEGLKVHQHNMHILKPQYEVLSRQIYTALLTGDTLGVITWVRDVTVQLEGPNKDIIAAGAEELLKKYHARNRPIDATPFN